MISVDVKNHSNLQAVFRILIHCHFAESGSGSMPEKLMQLLKNLQYENFLDKKPEIHFILYVFLYPYKRRSGYRLQTCNFLFFSFFGGRFCPDRDSGWPILIRIRLPNWIRIRWIRIRNTVQDNWLNSFFLNIFFGMIFYSFSYNIQHCFICRPSDSTVPTDAGIEPRTGPLQLVHWQSDALTTRLDLKRWIVTPRYQGR